MVHTVARTMKLLSYVLRLTRKTNEVGANISFSISRCVFVVADAWGRRAVSVVGSVVGRNFWQDRPTLGKKCSKACLPQDRLAFLGSVV